MKSLFFVQIFIMLVSVQLVYAKPVSMNKGDRIKVVKKIGQILTNDYFDAASAPQIEDALLELQRKSKYMQVKTPREFAALLTKDLFDLTNDLHFHVSVNSELATQIQQNQDTLNKKINKQKRRKEDAIAAQRENFYFKHVAMLEGGVGYLKLDSFSDPEFADEKLAAVMHFLADSKALIIDLRDNNGGHLELVQMLNSYFFESDDTTVFFDYFYNQDGKRIEKKQWVLPAVSGKRMLDTPLYILTSNATFSAAEWMSYSLKHLKRATIIGEVTAGGAHPVENKVIDHQFVINVPIGQIKSPATGDDFEGKGVKPNISIKAAKALHTAHLVALENLAKQENNYKDYQWYKPLIQSRMEPVTLSTNRSQDYSGSYTTRKIILDEGILYYSWNGKHKFALAPITSSLFSVAGATGLRMQMMIKDDKVIGYKRISQQGGEQEYLKD